MKLQKLFMATAVLAMTASGITAIAAEGELKTEDTTNNTIGFNAGKKQITKAPEFSAEQKDLGSDAEYVFNLSNENNNVLTFEDFTGDKEFTLTASQTEGFVNKSAGDKKLNATLTYSELSLASNTKTGKESELNLKDELVFGGNENHNVVTNGNYDAYGKWTITIPKVEVKASQNQAIAKGAYSTVINWNIGQNPSTEVK